MCLVTHTEPSKSLDGKLDWAGLQAAHIYPREAADSLQSWIVDNGSLTLDPDEILSQADALNLPRYRNALGGWSGIDSLQNLFRLRSDVHSFYDSFFLGILPSNGKPILFFPIMGEAELHPIKRISDPRKYIHNVDLALFREHLSWCISKYFFVPSSFTMKAAAEPEDLVGEPDGRPIGTMEVSMEEDVREAEEEDSMLGGETEEDAIESLRLGLKGMVAGAGTLGEGGEISFEQGQIATIEGWINNGVIPPQVSFSFSQSMGTAQSARS
ncbi:hypothetical protein T439DRAFT_188877 [Meredithblackwellia eburnea MCA 4105]